MMLLKSVNKILSLNNTRIIIKVYGTGIYLYIQGSVGSYG